MMWSVGNWKSECWMVLKMKTIVHDLKSYDKKMVIESCVNLCCHPHKATSNVACSKSLGSEF